MYTFFSTSDGTCYVESLNWSMKFYSSDEKVLEEYDSFIESWPNRDADEWSEWLAMTPMERQKIRNAYFAKQKKEKKKNMNSDCCGPVSSLDVECGATTLYSAPCHTHSFSLGSQAAPANWPYWATQANQKEEGNTPMCYAQKSVTKIEEVNESTVMQDQRKYLLSALYDAHCKFADELHEHFHMDPVGPKTIGDMIQWIKDGKFKEIKKEHLDSRYIYDLFHHLTWEDKENPADVDGYNKAKDAMKKAYKDAERTIKIKSPEAGLDALTAFESATFH